MFQIRIHGRRGQGVASSAAMPSVAAFLEGRYAQADVAAAREAHALAGTAQEAAHA